MTEEEIKYPQTGLFFFTNNRNMTKIDEHDEHRNSVSTNWNTITESLAVVAYFQDLQDQGLEEAMFPLNSPMPLTNYHMPFRRDHDEADIRMMEKVCYALNITSTIAYNLGVMTPYSNIGNVIPMGILFDSKQEFSKSMMDLVVTYY